MECYKSAELWINTYIEDVCKEIEPSNKSKEFNLCIFIDIKWVFYLKCKKCFEFYHLFIKNIYEQAIKFKINVYFTIPVPYTSEHYKLVTQIISRLNYKQIKSIFFKSQNNPNFVHEAISKVSNNNQVILNISCNFSNLVMYLNDNNPNNTNKLSEYETESIKDFISSVIPNQPEDKYIILKAPSKSWISVKMPSIGSCKKK